MSKEELYASIEKYYSLNEVDEEKRTLYKSNLAKFLDEVYDLSKPVVAPFTRRETFVFRKYNGVLDEGICQTQVSVGNQLNITRSSVNAIIKRINSCLLYVIKREEVESLGISVFDVFEDKRSLSQTPIGEIENSTNSVHSLMKKGVFTLEDLLKFHFYDLFTPSAQYFGDRIIDKVHKLGLKFVNELSDEERAEALNKDSCYDKVLDSSIYWLGLSRKVELMLKKMGIKKIGELREVRKQINVIDKQLKKFLIAIPDEKNNTIENTREKTIDYSLPIQELSLSNRARDCLLRMGVTTLGELKNVVRSDLLKMPTLGQKVYAEIIDKSHKYGFSFCDELQGVSKDVYLKTIEDSNPEKANLLNLSILQMGIDKKSFNGFFEAGITRVKHLIVMSTVDIHEIKGIGQKTVNDITKKIHEYGFQFVDEAIIASPYYKVKFPKKVTKRIISLKNKRNKQVDKYEELLLEKQTLEEKESDLNMVISDQSRREHGQTADKSIIKKA